MTNDGENSDDGIWMNKENHSVFEPLTNNIASMWTYKSETIMK